MAVTAATAGTLPFGLAKVQEKGGMRGAHRGLAIVLVSTWRYLQTVCAQINMVFPTPGISLLSNTVSIEITGVLLANCISFHLLRWRKFCFHK